MTEPNDRLSRMESYQNLPARLRNAVRLYLIHGIPSAEAMRLAGRDRNFKRDWQTDQVQKVLAEYGDPDGHTDWVARLKELEIDRSPAVLVPEAIRPQNADSSPTALTPPHTPSIEARPLISHPSAKSQNPALQTKDLHIDEVVNRDGQEPAPLVLSSVGMDGLFPDPIAREKSIQLWREQADTEIAERDRLIREHERRERLNHVL